MSEHIAPCPFCGDEAGPEIDGDEFATINSACTIFCNGCHASAATEHSYAEAVARWNTRPPIAPPATGAGEMRERVARIVDPEAWADKDAFFAKCGRGNGAEFPSLDLADQILALLSPADIAQVAPGVRE